MRISLDYDGTYTEDPALWAAFVAEAKAAGHEISIVTMRYPNEPIEDVPCDVIYTGRKAKKSFLEAQGIKIDVWIDDSPKWVLLDAAA